MENVHIKIPAASKMLPIPFNFSMKGAEKIFLVRMKSLGFSPVKCRDIAWAKQYGFIEGVSCFMVIMHYSKTGRSTSLVFNQNCPDEVLALYKKKFAKSPVSGLRSWCTCKSTFQNRKQADAMKNRRSK